MPMYQIAKSDWVSRLVLDLLITRTEGTRKHMKHQKVQFLLLSQVTQVPSTVRQSYNVFPLQYYAPYHNQ